jgi:hypothetical protein
LKVVVYMCVQKLVVVIPVTVIFLRLVKKCKSEINESDNECDMDMRAILKRFSVRVWNKTDILPNNFQVVLDINKWHCGGP